MPNPEPATLAQLRETFGEALPAAPLRLRDILLAAVATRMDAPAAVRANSVELNYLATCRERLGDGAHDLSEVFERTLEQPDERDTLLVALARQSSWAPAETLAIALACAVEEDPLMGRICARIQSPVGGSRPTIGLISTALESSFGDAVATEILGGEALRCGLLAIMNETSPLPERALAVPVPIVLALQGQAVPWPGTHPKLEPRIPLPESTLRLAQRHGAALNSTPGRRLAIRSGSLVEAKSVAAAIVEAMGRRPVFVGTDKIAGLGVWLRLSGLVPVFLFDLAPGERKRVPEMPGYSEAALVIAGLEGAIESESGTPIVWLLTTPEYSEREVLWQHAFDGANDPLAAQLARDHRHGAARIQQIGQLARYHAALERRAAPTATDVTAAAWTSEGGALESLAHAVRGRVDDHALVTPPELKRELALLRLRCCRRDQLTAGLGASATARYRPGVRALFVGPSGCGKTLAASWLATQLGLPLFRVDLASVTSKYIGETEKNLAQLLARAEQSEVVLLFDEADSLFGKRTEIKDSHDRFANAQTNYLLQRLENYEGLVLLTSNSKARFDAAFARRLDVVIEFNLPAPEERRALWQTHLGELRHGLSPLELNHLAATSDLAGGHICNAVLTAALLASEADRKIHWSDCVAGLVAEYRKMGRQAPCELAGWDSTPKTGT